MQRYAITQISSAEEFLEGLCENSDFYPELILAHQNLTHQIRNGAQAPVFRENAYHVV